MDNREIKTKYKTISAKQQCYIIAEMSANHAGDFKKAKKIIHSAKECGADCIKIQTYTPDTMTIDCDNEYFKIKHGAWKGENLYDLYKKAYTPWDWQAEIKEEAEKVGLDFLSTPFDSTSVDFLEGIGVGFYKIASFELTDIPLLKYVASKNKPIILSTGMATLGELEYAVKTIKSINGKLCLLKCSSDYPAVPENLNLATIKNMSETFNVITGFSDHTLGSVSAVTAVVLGAKIIEKHFCISREEPSPDSSFSMEPHEFMSMVKDIREAEKAVGIINYELSKSERKNRNFRRSVFVVENVKKGDKFTAENIRIIRPSYGLEPECFERILGKRASRDIEKGTPLKWELIF